MRTQSRPNDPLRVIQLGSTALVVVLLTLRSTILGLELHQICLVVSVLAGAAVWVVTLLTARRAWSATTAYLAVFVLFHFGLALLNATGQPLPSYSVDYITSWFNDFGTAPEALYVSLVACWVFVAAAAWATPLKVGHQVAPEGAQAPADPAKALASRMGAALVIVGTALVLGFVAVTAPSLLLAAGGRSTYWVVVEGSAVQLLATPLITYGGLLLALGIPGRARTVGLLALGLFGAWALAVGARTAIMYTVLAMVVVVARRRRMPPLRVAVAVFAVGLVAVGFIGQARIGSDQASLDPRAGMAELGSSVRPVIEVVELVRVNNEPLLMGATYVSFASRGIERVLGLPRPDGLTDPRIAGNEFRGRLDGYQIGYSAVAEAFRNGALPGVVVVFGLFGSLLGRLDARRSRRLSGDFALGVVFFALAFHIRQPSVSLVANVAIGLMIFVGWRLLTRQHDPPHVPGTVRGRPARRVAGAAATQTRRSSPT